MSSRLTWAPRRARGGADAARAPAEPAEAIEPAEEPDEATSGPRRIGLFGGTFDPPHLGHLVLAAAAAEQFELDRVLLIPAGIPPNKQGRPMSSSTDRLLMTRLAIAGEPRFELSTIEIERPGPSYTVDTVDQLAELYPGHELLLVMAADSLADIDGWREPDRLLSLVEWLVGPRPGSTLPERAALDARFGELSRRIHYVDAPPLGISSSDLRDRVAEGRSIRYLVPRAVEEQIARRRLYRRPRR